MSIFTSVKKGYVKFKKAEGKNIKVIEENIAHSQLTIESDIYSKYNMPTKVYDTGANFTLTVNSTLTFKPKPENNTIEISEKQKVSFVLSVESNLSPKQKIKTYAEDGKTAMVLYVLTSLQEV